MIESHSEFKLRLDLEIAQDELKLVQANRDMERETMSEITMELRQELKDAYKHISVSEDHIENLLQKVYTMEIEK